VLLVSDDDTDVEAGSVHVNAGHFNDPEDRAGLAHFHEHMLFLGTEKYPEENDYETFLSKNGGSTNAYTDMEDTNYYFSVAPLNHENDSDEDEDTLQHNGSNNNSTVSSALDGALDRLAQFFIAPLFKEEAVERELRAVDSEYVNAIPQDNWRQYQFMKSLSSPEHPFYKFGCGNYKTLTNGGSLLNNGTTAIPFTQSGGTSPIPSLHDFWNTYYHAGNVQLAVISRASLDNLQKCVETHFSALRPGNSNISTPSPPSIPLTTLFPTEGTRYAAKAFEPSSLGKIHKIIPIVDSRSVKISFLTPPSLDPDMVATRPHRAISHLLGHESPGSLHSLLSDLGLINGLSSGMGVDTSDFALFQVSVSLTPEGMKQVNLVIDLVFQWIRMIKNAWEDGESNVGSSSSSSSPSSLLETYHDELRRMTDVSFRFRESPDPVNFVSGAAEMIGRFPPKNVLDMGSSCGDYDHYVTGVFLERIVPQNAMIQLFDKDFEREEQQDGNAWSEERWYRAKYQSVEMGDEQMTKWERSETIDERLHLPKLNEFIPTDFSIRCDDVDDAEAATTRTDISANGAKDDDKEEGAKNPTPPTLLIDTPKLRLWHKMDRTYRVPKTFIKVQITTPNVYRSPRTMTLNRLYQKVLNDDLNSYVYDASLAGCNYRVACTPTGYSISVTGYSQKLPILLDVLTSRMLSLLSEMKDPTSHPLLLQRFQKASVNLLRETNNFKLDAPYETANYNARVMMEERAWHLSSYIEELERGLDMEECAQVVEECLTGRNRIQALCMGNISPTEAQRVASVVNSHFSASPALFIDETPQFKSHQAPLSTPTIYQDVAHGSSEENNAVEYNLQVGSDATLGYRGVALLELIGYLAYNSAFSQLRTKEQLGYIVSAHVRKTVGGARYLSVVVQSSTTLPIRIEERVENWLANFREELVDIDEERLRQEAAAIVAQLLERDTKLSHEVGRFWGEIASTDIFAGRLRQPVFDRVDRLAKEFTREDDGGITGLKKDIVQFFDEYLRAGAPQRRVVSARVYSKKDGIPKEMTDNVGEKGVLGSWEDVVDLKQFLGCWPVAPYWDDDGVYEIDDVEGMGD